MSQCTCASNREMNFDCPFHAGATSQADRRRKIAAIIQEGRANLKDSLLGKDYRVRQFPDGWWSVCFYIATSSWGQFRGPFNSEADAEMDCANAVGRFQKV